MSQIINFSKFRMIFRQYYYDKIKLKIFIIELDSWRELTHLLEWEIKCSLLPCKYSNKTLAGIGKLANFRCQNTKLNINKKYTEKQNSIAKSKLKRSLRAFSYLFRFSKKTCIFFSNKSYLGLLFLNYNSLIYSQPRNYLLC